MKIDLAVYTGDVGYDWHHTGAFSRDELIAYKRIMGKFPDPDFGRMSFGGAFNEGPWLVFYRYHYAKRWDNLGRDSIYVVVGRVPLASAAAVDFKCVFALTEMNQPMKPFPTVAMYVGPQASTAAPAFTSQRMFAGTDAFSYIGAWFAVKPEGRLVVTIDGDYANPRLLPRFEPSAKPVVPAPVPAASAFGAKPSVGWTPGNSQPSVPAVAGPRMVSLTTCLVLSLGLFVLGGAGGYALRGWIGAGGSIGDKLSQKVTEVTGYKIEKVAPPQTATTSPAEISPADVPSAKLDEPPPAKPEPAVTNPPPIQTGINTLDRTIETVRTNATRKVEDIRGNAEKLTQKVRNAVETLSSGKPPAEGVPKSIEEKQTTERQNGKEVRK